MKLTFIGSGNVGAPLADRLQRAGHEVVLAKVSDNSSSLEAALARNPNLRAEPVEAAVEAADVVFLATPFGAVTPLVEKLGSKLSGKILIDCTNPVGPGLSHGLKSERSGSELIQALAPFAHVIKAFTIYGFENLENSNFPGYGVRPAMMFCGQHGASKQVVATLIEQVGLNPSTWVHSPKLCTSST